jgi:mannose-6-phosphate isomerase-like protein (cupin superfamily)
MILTEFYLGERANKTPFKFSKFYVAVGGQTPADKHQVNEIWYVIQGEGELTYDENEVVSLKKGEAIFFDSQVTHTIKNTGSSAMEIMSVWWN